MCLLEKALSDFRAWIQAGKPYGQIWHGAVVELLGADKLYIVKAGEKLKALSPEANLSHPFGRTEGVQIFLVTDLHKHRGRHMISVHV